MSYYILYTDGLVKVFDDVVTIDKSFLDMIVLHTEAGEVKISLNEVILHGDKEYWTQIIELFKTIDRLANKMVKTKLQKAASFGYLAGLLGR